MASTMRFFTWFAGASIALYIGTFLVLLALDVRPESAAASNLDLSKSLTWFRLAGYIAFISSWNAIANAITRAPKHLVLDSKALAEREKKRQVLKSARWKAAVFFVVFELLAIQQILGGFAA